MDNEGEFTTAFANLYFVPVENLTVFAEFWASKSTQKMDNISIDLNQVEGTPHGFDYFLMEDLGRLSELDVLQIRGRYGMEYAFKGGWFVKGYFEHINYNDDKPYLFDATGDLYRVAAFAGYRF